MKYFKKFNIINRSHHFVKNRSCLTNLLQLLEVFNNCINQGLPVDVDVIWISKRPLITFHTDDFYTSWWHTGLLVRLINGLKTCY